MAVRRTDGCGVGCDSIRKMLALQGILTYCAIRPLPYHLYADEGGLLVLSAPLTSASLSKISFLTDCGTAGESFPAVPF